MDGSICESNDPPLPLSCLRLLVPPIRLVSAAIWQTIQQKAVADYGMLEEFVAMVTAAVPELLTRRQQVELTLGLRARLILELCRSDAISLQFVQPHLDRMQVLTALFVFETGAVDVEMSTSNFTSLVQTLLKNPAERQQFFKSVFPEEFGPRYDRELQSMIWQFLSRLEKLLPLQSLQQVSSLIGDVPNILEECMRSVSDLQELKTLLEYQKHLNQLDQNDCSNDGVCIFSSRNLSSDARKLAVNEVPQSDICVLGEMFSLESGIENESPRLDKIQLEMETVLDADNRETKTEQQPHLVTIIKTDETDEPFGGSMTRSEDISAIVPTRTGQKSHCDLSECTVLLDKIDVPASLKGRPVRRNRGLKMQAILSKEKRRFTKKDNHVNRSKCGTHQAPSSSRKFTGPSVTKRKVTSTDVPTNEPIAETSDDEDSISVSSEQDPSYMAPLDSSCEGDSTSDSAGESDSIVDPTDDEDYGDDLHSKAPVATTHTKTNAPKNRRSISERHLCCICKEHVKVNMVEHMKVHFPDGVYTCPHCNTKIPSLACLKRHVKRTCCNQKQVKQNSPKGARSLFRCDQCDQAFRFKVALAKHKHTHNPLYCDVCMKVLRDAETLARHKVSHTPFHCTLCEENFRLYKPLARHYQQVHKLSKPFNCNHCPKSFSTLRCFVRHEWRHTDQLPFQCSQCSKRFKDDSNLIVHLRIHSGEKVFLCWKCGRAFSHRVSLKRHVEICQHRNVQKPHSCTQCPLSFKLKDSLRTHEKLKHKATTNASSNYRRCFVCKKQVAGKIKDHMKIHFPNGICVCPQCNTTFALLSSLKLHMKRTCFDQQKVGPEEAKEAESLFKCDECHQVFRYELSLREHKRTHNELYCEVCRKVLRDSEAIARHKVSHTAFQCTLCDETFRHYRPLSKHYENMHKLGRPFTCNHCPKQYNKLKSFVRHEWKHKGYLPFQCTHCSMRFKDDPDLVSHLRVHTREKPFLCAECGKAFSSKSNLTRHLKFIHILPPNEKRHSCSECGKSYKEKGALDKHEKKKHLNIRFRSPCPDCGKLLSSSAMGRHRLIHTGEKPYKCKISGCDRGFRSVTELKKHVLQCHTEERPFKCEVCEKGFIRPSILSAHMRIHSGEKPYVCLVCGKAFLQLYSMKRHKKLVHTFEVE